MQISVWMRSCLTGLFLFARATRLRALFAYSDGRRQGAIPQDQLQGEPQWLEVVRFLVLIR